MRISVLTISVVASLFTTSLAAQTLNGAQIETALSGQSYDYVGMVNGRRLSGNLTYAAGGSLVVKTESDAPEGGTWQIKGHAVCTRLVNLRGGNETCYTLRRQNRNRLTTSHGFTLIKSK